MHIRFNYANSLYSVGKIQHLKVKQIWRAGIVASMV